MDTNQQKDDNYDINVLCTSNSMFQANNQNASTGTRSWMEKICEKFNKSNSDKTKWEPPFWQTICPYPYCPTYSSFARYFSFIFIFLLMWGILYVISPVVGIPSSQFCNMVALIILSYISGNLLFKITNLPALIGMLFMGILLQNVGFTNIEGDFSRIPAELRKVAVVIILMRAGLNLDNKTLKRMLIGILKLGLIPWAVECIIIAIFSHFFLNLPWGFGFLLGSIIASVSPAVVVPCFIKLQNEGYGVEKGIPTLVLAAASIDDTISIAIFGIISSILFTDSSLLNNILQGPLSIIGGIAYGVIWAYILKYLPEKNSTYLGSLRTIILFLSCYLAYLGSSKLGYAGAGPIAVITASLTANLNWTMQGWEVKKSPVANALRLLWIVFEPTLFAITGAQIKINELDGYIVGIGAACLFGSVFLRIIATIIICFGTNFNMKEKIFVGLSWMAKATVQAAMGPMALESIINNNGSATEIEYGKTILMVSILSIVLTAPLGAFLISMIGPKLLSKSSGNVLEDNSHMKRISNAADENNAGCYVNVVCEDNTLSRSATQ